MSITYYANKIQETSTTNGSGNFVLSGATLGSRSFVGAIGSDKKLAYYIYRRDTNLEWEIGIGYISSGGGVNQLVRERVLSSTNGNNFVSFSSGTKYVESVVADNLINNGFVNLEEKSSSFTAPYAPAVYVVDASVTGVTVTLPQVNSEDDPVILSFLLKATIGGAYEQSNAIVLDPYGTETINGSTSSETVTILNDYLQLISVPSQTGWLKLDPVQDSTNPYGNDGYVQFKYDGSFSGVNNFVWDYSSSSLLIGNSGNATADIVLPSSSGQTTIFNQRLYDNDLRVAGTGNTHLLFVDGGANTIGINTSAAYDTLTINSNNKNGIVIYKSGVGPSIVLGNTSTSGLATNNVVGTITYSGLNSANAPVAYSKIVTEIESTTSGSEKSLVNIGIMNNGSFEDVAVFAPSGITLGFNNSNLDGTIIGGASSNEGNNVVLGYYNNICGENCAVIGDNCSLSSGTFGGLIGSNHSASGNNIWVIGGENVSVSGNNKIYIATNNDNHFSITSSGNATYTTLTDNNVVFSIKNKSILASGIDESLVFTFVNSSGVEKTGLALVSNINAITNNSERSTFIVKSLNSGVLSEIINVNGNGASIGRNSISGVNTVVGHDNTVISSGNFIFGKSIVTSGTNNILFGDDIVCSGSNMSIFGINNTCLSSGNFGVVIIGNNNEVNEDYVTAIGIGNANSGLYSVTCGYLNGAHGDYSVGLGESNLVTANNSVAVGKNNSLLATANDGSLVAFGIGNYGSISNTGFMAGYLNQIYGSGGLVFGNNIVSSGNNNIVIGANTKVSGINNILLSNNSLASFSGNNIISLYTDASNYINVSNTGVVVKTSSDFVVDSGLIVYGSISVDNLKLDGNTLSSTSGNLILVPSGTNAFQLDPSGNLRGSYAVDLQRGRSSALSVASGTYSFLGGGYNNRTAGSFSSIIGGSQNINNAQESFIGGGQSNTIGSSGTWSCILGGANNSISGIHSSIIAGAVNNSTGDYTTINGFANVSSGDFNVIFGGYNNDGGYDNVFIFGQNITGIQPNTTYVEDLIAKTGYLDKIVVGSGTSGNNAKLFVINDVVSIGTGVWNSGTMEVSDEGDFIVRNSISKVIDIDFDGTYATGDFTSFSTDQLILPSMISVSGSGSVQSLLYQNNQVEYNNLASSGTFVSPRQLTHTDAEYQFLYPTGSSIVYLPNGTGLYLGKKFTIANMSSVNTIEIRKSGAGSAFETLSSLYNITLAHGGNDNWIKITASTLNT